MSEEYNNKLQIERVDHRVDILLNGQDKILELMRQLHEYMKIFDERITKLEEHILFLRVQLLRVF